MNDVINDILSNIKYSIFEAGINVSKAADNYDNKKYLMETYTIDDNIEIFINDETVQESTDIFQEAVFNLKSIPLDDNDNRRIRAYKEKYKYDFLTNDTSVGKINRQMVEALATGYNASERSKGRRTVKLKNLRNYEDSVNNKYPHKYNMTMFLIKCIKDSEDNNQRLCIFNYGTTPFGGLKGETTEDTGLVYWYIYLPKSAVRLSDELIVARVLVDKYKALKERYQTPESRESNEFKKIEHDIGVAIKKTGYSSAKDVINAFKEHVEKSKIKGNIEESMCSWHISKSNCPGELKGLIDNPDTKITINNDKGINVYNDLNPTVEKVARYFDIL